MKVDECMFIKYIRELENMVFLRSFFYWSVLNAYRHMFVFLIHQLHSEKFLNNQITWTSP